MNSFPDAAPAPGEALADRELKRARNSAYGYLAIRPRSSQELAVKLRGRDFPDAIIAAVIEHCTRLGYLNDSEFARQWAASRVRSRGFGRRRIEQELRQKGIGRVLIQETLADLFEQSPEIDTARREAEKKLRSLERFAPEVRKRRLAGHLERKGFPPATIRDVLRQVT